MFELKKEQPEQEDIYFDQLFELEQSIIEVFRKTPDLIDLEVLSALDATIMNYKNFKRGFSQKSFNSTEIIQSVYENIETICKELISSETNVKEISIDELLWCLRRIKKSLKMWNKNMGRQGYLNFIDEHII